MTGNKMPLVVGKLITSGLRAAATEATTSPRTPLEFKVLSPRRVVNCDMGGVGLGIVAALEKSGDSFPVKQPAFASRNPVRSDPIPVNQARIVVDQQTENDTGSLEEEEYTIVTCHKPGKSYTKVYRGGCVTAGERSDTREPPSPPARPDGDTKIYPSSEFLSLCHLCKKKLHGKDIYMYRGEKAFCSTECRWWQIGVDERREKCGSEASRSVSGSPCDHGRNCSAGIFAI